MDGFMQEMADEIKEIVDRIVMKHIASCGWRTDTHEGGAYNRICRELDSLVVLEPPMPETRKMKWVFTGTTEDDSLTEPQPVPWEPGWLALWNGRNPIYHLSKRTHDAPQLVRYLRRDRANLLDEYGTEVVVNPLDFSIPTRAQIAVEIGRDDKGEAILAWACDQRGHPSPHEAVKAWYSDITFTPHSHEYRRRIEAIRMGLHIVSASQVERMYGGVFPPKEE